MTRERKRGKGLFEGADNDLGPIGPDVRERILRYLDDPSAKNWDDVYTIIINRKGSLTGNPPGTVWQAVCAIDPSYRHIAVPHQRGTTPEKRWNKWPDALLLARAIKTAIEPTHGRYKK